MTPTVCLSLGAAADAAISLTAGAVLTRASHSATGPRKPVFFLCTAGFLVGATGLAVAGGWVAAHGLGPGPLIVAALAVSVQTLLVLAGGLRAGGVGRPVGVAMRRGSDGLLLASCGAYTMWSLFLAPAHLSFLGRPLHESGKTVAVLLLAPNALALGICATVAWRTRRTGPGPLLGAITLGAVAGPCLWITAGYRSAPTVVVTAVAYGVSTWAAAWCLRRGVLVRDEPRRLEQSGTLLAWAPVSVAIVAGMIRLAVYHNADNTSILIAAVIGAALGLRQTFAMRDIRAYAREALHREARYRELALTDPLTSLGNRRAFAETLEQRVLGGPPSVVLSIDLDGFKNINDLRGHDVGDSVLIEVARRLRANLRPDDIAARLGGDEFAVVLWLRHEEAVAAASRLRSVLAAPYDIAGCALFLSASIGLAAAEGVTDVADLMRNADLALRFAKLRGKNRVEGYAEAYAQWLRRRVTVESELRGAIGRGEFSVLYQPVVALATGAIVGVEALLRWHHPTLGAVLPAEFIPIAEDSHLIEDIGRWVLGETCRQLANWRRDGWELWLSVNVSVHELHRSDFVTQVTGVLTANRLPPERLVLEVTEHAVAVDIDELMESMAALRGAGVRVALDDFGAGYSSLGQMHLLPVDMLKVGTAVLAAGSLGDVVARLGQRLGLGVIVMGVTERAERAVMEAAGCVYAQGDLFARPMPAEHLEARLATDLVPMPRPAS